MCDSTGAGSRAGAVELVRLFFHALLCNRRLVVNQLPADARQRDHPTRTWDPSSHRGLPDAEEDEMEREVQADRIEAREDPKPKAEPKEEPSLLGRLMDKLSGSKED